MDVTVFDENNKIVINETKARALYVDLTSLSYLLCLIKMNISNETDKTKRRLMREQQQVWLHAYEKTKADLFKLN
jgi:hypothetical protein